MTTWMNLEVGWAQLELEMIVIPKEHFDCGPIKESESEIQLSHI